LMLSSHLRLGLPSGLLLSDLPTKMLYAPLTSPMRATCPAHLILLALITLTIVGEEYKPCSSSCSFLQPPVKYFLRLKNQERRELAEHTYNLSIPVWWCVCHRNKFRASTWSFKKALTVYYRELPGSYIFLNFHLNIGKAELWTRRDERSWPFNVRTRHFKQ
jgi:hypothetical protein